MFRPEEIKRIAAIRRDWEHNELRKCIGIAS